MTDPLVTVEGANDGKPVELVSDTADGSWHGQLGLRQPGAKSVAGVEALLSDGQTVDVTDAFFEAFAFDDFDVRFPEEDSFGECPD